MSTSLTAYGWGLLVALTWGGCELAAQVPLPRCLDGQGLMTDTAGNFLCITLQRAHLTVPPPAAGCAAGQGLAYLPDLKQLSCRDNKTDEHAAGSSVALQQRIDGLVQQFDSLEASVANLEPALHREHLYVGSTTAVTTGRITAAGKAGVLAAAALCAAQFGAGAHMCTQLQLTRTLATGKLGVKDRIAPAWVYMPTWHNPGSSTVEPRSGLADNCGGYTTGEDTAGWSGMAVEWSPLPAGEVAFRWHGGTEARCSASLPIACCMGGR